MTGPVDLTAPPVAAARPSPAGASPAGPGAAGPVTGGLGVLAPGAGAVLEAAPRPDEELCLPCESCQQHRAGWGLTYPDVRFRVCSSCLPADLALLAEPLDPDEDLAQDPRTASERSTQP